MFAYRDTQCRRPGHSRSPSTVTVRSLDLTSTARRTSTTRCATSRLASAFPESPGWWPWSRCTAPSTSSTVGRGGLVPPEADGLVTALPGVVLMVRVADCVPVLLADPAAGVVGVAHAGRTGMAAGVVPAPSSSCAARRRTRSPRGSARTSAAAATRCPNRCAPRLRLPCPSPSPRRRGAPRPLDLGAGVMAQLEQRRGARSWTQSTGAHSRTTPSYSYRRDGVASGPFLGGLVWVRP